VCAIALAALVIALAMFLAGQRDAALRGVRAR
jgi:hypothetical protein